jgi:hypothetical protein
VWLSGTRNPSGRAASSVRGCGRPERLGRFEWRRERGPEAPPAVPAKADDNAVYAYTATFGAIVCQTLDTYPTINGVIGVGEAIAADGLSMHQAGQVLMMSAFEICPRHLGLLRRYADTYNQVPA